MLSQWMRRDDRVFGYTWYYVTVSLCSFFAASFLILHIYTRLRITKKIYLSDYLIFLAFPLLIVEIVLGRLSFEPAKTYATGMTINYAYNSLYNPTMVIVKLAILTQYLRILAPNRTVNPLMFWGSWITIIICLLFYTIVFFLNIFYFCAPSQNLWYYDVYFTCMNESGIQFMMAAFNIASDVVILLLPTASVWRMRIPVRKKCGVSALFGIGLFACIASIVRIIPTSPTLYGYSSTESVNTHYNTEWSRLWMFAEITLGFIVACALSLPEFIRAKAPGGLRQRLNKHFGFSQSSEREDSTSREGSMSNELESGTVSVGSRGDYVGGGVVVSKPEPLSLVVTRTYDSID